MMRSPPAEQWLPGVFVAVVLGFPHLVLAHVGDDDGLAAGEPPNVMNDMSGVQLPVARHRLNVADGRPALLFLDPVQPLAAAPSPHPIRALPYPTP